MAFPSKSKLNWLKGGALVCLPPPVFLGMVAFVSYRDARDWRPVVASILLVTLFGIPSLLLYIRYQSLNRPVWHIARKGTVVSGLRAGRLHYLVRTRRLSPSDHVYRQGMKDWIRAAKVQNLFTDTDLLEYAAFANDASGASHSQSVGPTRSLAYVLGSVLGLPQFQKLVLVLLAVALTAAIVVGSVRGFGVFGSTQSQAKLDRPANAAISTAPFVVPGPSSRITDLRASIRGAALGRAYSGGATPSAWAAGAEALADRAYQEEILVARARAEGATEEARKHEQRVADFVMAAKFYLEEGRFPPGFDADLANK